MKSYNNPNVIYLLDGFDEIGTQMWTTDEKKMRHTREVSAAALKDLISSTMGGVLISGREYCFNSDAEMLNCFGLDEKKHLYLNVAMSLQKCKFRNLQKKTVKVMLMVMKKDNCQNGFLRDPSLCNWF